MKIIITTHQFLPEHATGIEVLTYHVAKDMQRRGHEVKVLTGFPDETPHADAERFDQYVYDGIEVIRFRYGEMPMGGQSNLMALEYDNPVMRDFFSDWVQRERPDAVYCFHLMRLSSALMKICWQRGIPYFFIPTDYWAICPVHHLLLPNESLCNGPDNLAANCVRHMAQLHRPDIAGKLAKIPHPLLRIAVRLAGWLGGSHYARMAHALRYRPRTIIPRLNGAQRIFTPNRFIAWKLASYGVNAKRMQLSPYGMKLPNIIPPRIPHPKGTLRIGFIGDVVRGKGLHILIEAVRDTPHLPVELMVYGDMNTPSAYISEVASQAGGDPRIRFCGPYSNDRLVDVLAGLDVLVVPSIWQENIPLEVHSASLSQCPIIASQNGAMSEVIEHRKNGLLFPAGDAKALSALLQQVEKDRAMLESMVEHIKPPRSMTDYVSELLAAYDESSKTPAKKRGS